MLAIEQEEAAALERVDGRYRSSARNLLHFIAFHRHAHPNLAPDLRQRGLCSFEGCDSHLMASLQAVITVLDSLASGRAAGEDLQDGPPPAQGLETLQDHCDRLFGSLAAQGATGIMVTLPSPAADHPALITELVQAGMTIARINCAHDGPEIWSRLVEGVAQARRATGKACRIAMDLAGPKLRTGLLTPQSAVIRARPERDRLGRRLKPARLLAVPEDALPQEVEEDVVLLPVKGKDWKRLKPGDRLQGRDASRRRRRFSVLAMRSEGVLLHCRQSCHFTSGLVFRQVGGRARLRVASLPPDPGERRLRPGERLNLTPEPDQGPGTIPCTLPQVFFDLRIGERVLFDEGRIAAVIRAVAAEEVLLEITQAKPQGSRLLADKGINFPDSDLRTPALTAKDIEDLAFAADHADIVNYSFVNRESDIEALRQSLQREGREDLALVLKIETRRAFLNLPRLLLMAMRQGSPLGVMIARGDLAIECGWEALAGIQEEILRICAAAHVPCIWATQVLDEMAHHGLPTRAEISDASMGARAEAVMLNKGPNITATVRTLQAIVNQSALGHRDRAEPLLACLAFRSNCDSGYPPA